MAEQVVIGALRYDVVADTAKFEKAMVATKTELRQSATEFRKTRTPAERYGQEIERLNNLRRKGLIDAATYRRGLAREADAYKKATKEAKGLTTAQKGLAASTKAVDLSMAGLSSTFMRFAPSAAGLLSVGAGLRAIGNELEEIDRITKTGIKLGVGTDELQALRLAGEQLAGMADTTVDMALQRMTRRLAEAAAGTGEAKKAIEELNLSAADLAAMTPDKAFRELANAIADVQNPADQLRIAFKLFDSEGAAMVNVLKEGSAGLDLFEQKIIDSGLALDKMASKDVAKAQDALSDLSASFQGVRREATIAAAPMVTGLSDLTSQAIALQRELREAVANPAQTIREMMGGQTREEVLSERVAEAAQPAIEADTFRSGIRKAAQDEVDFIAGIGSQIATQATEGWNKWVGIAKEAQIEVEAAGVQMRKEADAKMQKEEEKQFEEQERERQKEADALRKRVDAVLTDIKTPFDEFAESLAEINDLLAQGAISTQTFQAAQDQLIAARGQQLAKEAADRPEIARRGSEEEFQQLARMRSEQQAGMQAQREAGQAKTLTPQDYIKGVTKMVDVLTQLLTSSEETTAAVETLEPQVAV